MSDEAMTPTDAEVLQEEAPPPEDDAVPIPVRLQGPTGVRLEGPARVQSLPARTSGMRRYSVTTDQPFLIAPADPRRRTLQVQAYDSSGTCSSVLVASARSQVEHTGARLAMLAGAGSAVATPVLTLTAADEVWVMPVDGACEVSTYGEQWAD